MRRIVVWTRDSTTTIAATVDTLPAVLVMRTMAAHPYLRRTTLTATIRDVETSIVPTDRHVRPSSTRAMTSMQRRKQSAATTGDTPPLPSATAIAPSSLASLAHTPRTTTSDGVITTTTKACRLTV